MTDRPSSAGLVMINLHTKFDSKGSSSSKVVGWTNIEDLNPHFDLDLDKCFQTFCIMLIWLPTIQSLVANGSSSVGQKQNQDTQNTPTDRQDDSNVTLPPFLNLFLFIRTTISKFSTHLPFLNVI